jgi:hypothetical protein
MDEAKIDQLERLFTLAEIERLTIGECADRMGISEYAVKQLRKDPDYATVRAARRADMREKTVSQVHELGDLVIDALRDLIIGAKSEFVRFQAAAKLGDWLGLGNMAEKAQEDDREEMRDFLKSLHQRPITVTVTLPQPAPGGLLPELPQLAADPIIDSTEA